MKDNEQYTKYEIEKSFHEFLDGFNKDTRFFNPINWEYSFCVQTTNNKRNMHKEQQKIEV